MGHWNYRVVRRSTDDDGKPLDVPIFGVHEAYYNDDEVKPHSISLSPVAAIGDTVQELREVLTEMMGRALSEPVLEWEGFGMKSENGNQSAQQDKKSKGS